MSTSERYYRTKSAGSSSLTAFKNIRKSTTATAPPKVKTVDEYFQECVNNRKSPSLEMCRKYIDTYQLEKTDRLEKRIQDRVRTLIKQAKRLEEN